MVDAQKSEVEKVLAELDVSKTPTIEVFNKIDLLDDAARNQLVHHTASPATACVSGLTGEGIVRAKQLLQSIDAALTRRSHRTGRPRASCNRKAPCWPP